jgi:hypothetical protein
MKVSLKGLLGRLIGPLRDQFVSLLAVDTLSEMKAELDLRNADRIARLHERAQELEREGHLAAAADLRRKADAQGLHLGHLQDAEAGLQHLLLSDATADPPPAVPALPPPANGHVAESNGSVPDGGVARTPPPVKRGPGRPPRTPSAAAEPTAPNL